MKLLWRCFFLFFTVLCLHAQTAREMDTLLEAESLNYAQAARFILSASGVLGDNISPGTAFAAAQSRGWVPRKAAAGDPVKLGGAALLLMKSFDLRGGLFYRFFPNPRYAYRELVYRRVIQGAADSSMPLSGEYFFQILGRTMDYAETKGAKNSGGQKK